MCPCPDDWVVVAIHLTMIVSHSISIDSINSSSSFIQRMYQATLSTYYLLPGLGRIYNL